MEPTAYKESLEATAAKLLAMREELFEAIFQIAITDELREWSATIEVGETYSISKELLESCADTNVQLLTTLLTAIERTCDSLLNINKLDINDILPNSPQQSMNPSEQAALLEVGKKEDLPASRVFAECMLPASRYACFLYAEYWLTGHMPVAKLLEALRAVDSPEVAIWQYCHSSLVERLPRTRELMARGIPFIKEFADYLVRNERSQYRPVNWLSSLTREIHQAAAKDIDFFFAEIAATIMGGLVIQTPTTAFRITELEFYCQRPTHQDQRLNHHDPYVHGEAEQLKHLHWYFNKATSLDLTFGDEDTKSYGGILVRGLCALTPENNFKQSPTYPYFIGPQVATRALVASWGSALEGATELKLQNNPEPFDLTGSLWTTPRVGLKSLAEDEREAQPYSSRPYRFLADKGYLKRLPGKEKLCQELKMDAPTTLEILGYKPAWL